MIPKVEDYSIQQLINFQAYLKRVLHRDIVNKSFNLRKIKVKPAGF
jgi:hypothetical protein